MPQDGVRVCLLSLESPHSLRTIVPVGAALPMDRGSAGKVLAATPTPSAGVGPRASRSGSAAWRRSARRSWSTGNVIAAVSVSGPLERTSRQPGRRYAAAVVEAARAVERALL